MLDLSDFYEVLVNAVRIAYHCGVAGVLWGVGLGVAVVAAGRAGRWARQRCDEALAGAHFMPAPAERSFALIAGTCGRSPSDDGNRTLRILKVESASRHRRALVREQRAFQQALDVERRGGTFLARRAASTVHPWPPGA